MQQGMCPFRGLSTGRRNPRFSDFQIQALDRRKLGFLVVVHLKAENLRPPPLEGGPPHLEETSDPPVICRIITTEDISSLPLRSKLLTFCFHWAMCQ